MDRNTLKENRFHGDGMLPLCAYHMNNITGQNILDCHWHNELEFLLITEGKTIFQIEASCFEVAAGQAVFLNSGELHAAFSCGSPSCSFSALVFDPIILFSRTYDAIQVNFIDPVIKNQLSLQKHIKNDTEWEKDIVGHLKEIFRAFDSRCETFELLIKAHLYMIFSALIANSNKELYKNNNSTDLYKIERLKEVLNYIHTNYNQKITLKELARLINMSEGHFCRFFKQMTRRTPIDYINYYRINQAAKLLESTDKRVFDIAMDVGFYNFSYFINIFSIYMKCTPSEYRKSGALEGRSG